jgi:3',5'-cyclic AMP phosphodiesterase CpdA
VATLLAQISDPHVRLGELGPASEAALAHAVEAVNALPSPPDAVLLTGDVTDTADPREYALAREILSRLDAPLHVLPGNHDDAAAFADAFGATAWATTVGGLRIVGCDSTRAGADDGELDLDWLAERLDEDRATPTIVAMHHAPFDVGMLALDAIGLPLAQRADLAGLLSRHPQVRRVVAGHVHRAAADTLGGCTAVSCTSVHLQTRLEIGSTTFDLSPEPPGFLLHALLDGGPLVTHAQPL